MAFRRVDESPSDCERSQREWCGGRFQVYIHNLLVGKLDSARLTLENAADYPAFQNAKQRVEVIKEMIGWIHEHDSDSCKKNYGLK
jgi:hypothetical protein